MQALPYRLLLGFLFFLFFFKAFGQDDPYNDPKYQAWSKAFRNFEYQQVIKDVEQDLKRAKPHPMAISVWLTAQQATGKLDQALQSYQGPAKQKLKTAAEIAQHYNQSFHLLIDQSYNEKTLLEIGDPIILGDYMRTLNETRPFEAYQTIVAYAKRLPDQFQYAWLISDLSDSYLEIHDLVTKDLTKGVFAQSPAVEQYLKTILSYRPRNDYQVIAAAKTFVEAHPNDALAWRYLGKNLQTVEQYEEAIPYFEKAHELDPFYAEGVNLSSHAYSLAALHDYEKGQLLIEQQAKLYYPSNSEEKGAILWAEQLIKEKHYGKAWEVLKKGKKAFPDSHEIDFTLGKLIAAGGKKTEALYHFEQALNKQKYEHDYWLEYLTALQNTDEVERGLRAVKDVQDYLPVLSTELYDAISDLLLKQEDYEGAIDLINQGTKEIPYSAFLWRQTSFIYSQAKKPEKALKALQKAHQLYRPYSWSIGKYLSLLETRDNLSPAAIDDSLSMMAARFPWQEDIWEKIVARKKTHAEKLAIWEQAKKENSQRLFPYEKCIRLLAGREKWTEIEAQLEGARQNISESYSEDKLDLNFEAAIVTVLKLRKGQITRAEYQLCEQNFNAYLQGGGRPGAYYNYMSELYKTVGNTELSCEMEEANLLARPDESPWSVVQECSGKINWFTHWNRYCDRNPFNGSRIYEFARANVLYNGSPIIGLQLLDSVKRGFPNINTVWLEGKALGLLEANQKSFEQQYSRSTVVGASDRYIGWYNIARKSAWQGGAEVDLDYETATATLTFQDGTVAVRQDDPNSGKPKRIQVGDAFLKAEYNKKGKITELASSQGKKIQLVYDLKDNIRELISTPGDHLYFQYNSQGKPTQIKLAGLGRLDVTYDEITGEINSTDAIPEKEGVSASGLAITITSNFQSLMSIVSQFQSAGNFNDLPSIGIIDTTRETLVSDWQEYQYEMLYEETVSDKIFGKWLETSLILAKHLGQNTSVDADYGKESLDLSNQIFEETKATYNKNTRPYAVRAIENYYETLLRIRQRGVDKESWNAWMEMQEWLQLERTKEKKKSTYDQQIAQLLKRIGEREVVLLTSANWLPTSPLQNEGYWRSFDIAAFVPENLREDLQLTTVFYRQNGEVVVGTNRGFAVYQKGVWDWFSYHPRKGQFVRELNLDEVKASSHILSICEDAQQNLYLGTADGLFLMGDKYLGAPNHKYTTLDGLPENRIGILADWNGEIWVGTSKGLYYLQEKSFINDPALGKLSVDFITPLYPRLAVGTIDGLFYRSANGPNQFEKVSEERKAHAIFDQEGALYTLKGETLKKAEKKWVNEDSAWVEIEAYGTIQTTTLRQVYGLALMPIHKGEQGLAVLTDLGFSIYKDRHFEYFKLPFSTQNTLTPRKVSTRQDDFALLTDQTLMLFQKEEAYVYESATYDILHSDSLGITFLATETGLKYMLDKDPSINIQTLDGSFFGVSTTHLAMDDQNRLITNDGRQIMRFTFDKETGDYDTENLFYVDQYEPSGNDGYSAGRINGITVAKNGEIWVSSKLSVFRYRERESEEAVVEEFNWFREPDLFPIRTHMVHTVMELPDGRIWVVGSNEGHLNHKGTALSGGLLEWKPEKGKFERLNAWDNYRERNFNWFLHAMTPIGENEAILGSTGGFVHYKDGKLTDFDFERSYSPSYMRMKEGQPALFLGSKGCKYGEGWLFGSAAGVVIYYNGDWSYPDRLNRMLPDDLELGRFGSRHTNAVGTDARGRIFVGTDRGLMVYQGASNMATLYFDNDYTERAFDDANTRQLHQEREAILQQIDKGSEAGQMLSEIENLKGEINAISGLKASFQGSLLNFLKDARVIVQEDSVSNLLNNSRKRYTELLLKLEEKYPAIHQVVDIKPLNLITEIQPRLKPGEAILQYIPAPDRLLIQMVSRDEIFLAEQVFPADSLMNICKRVSDNLEFLAAYQESDLGRENLLLWKRNETLKRDLRVLYGLLLRPVDKALSKYKDIYIVPVQKMYYVPFSALINQTAENNFKYAVEDFNFSYLSSLYLWKLGLKRKPAASDKWLIMGDPRPGTSFALPGASAEVDAIHNLIPSAKVFKGINSTKKNLELNAKGSRIIHLATHGTLKPDKPSESSLMFHKSELALSDAFNLPLDRTEAVILSACQTGKGSGDKAGLEYATISRAFTNAGAACVIATLWKVEDQSTRELMIKFYEYILEGRSRSTAINLAQRDLIEMEEKGYDHPSKWASFILMGQPK